MSEVDKIKTALLAQGIDSAIVDSMLKSMKPKKDPTEKKKKGGWYPGMTSSTKIDKEVLVKTYCQCCSSVEEQTVNMKVTSKFSPDVQKLAVSVCSKCPDFVRQFSHEELVSMLLMGEKPTQEMQVASIRTKAKLAKKLTPEQVITFTAVADMKPAAPTATVIEEEDNAA